LSPFETRQTETTVMAVRLWNWRGSLEGETDEEGRIGTEILRAEREKDQQKEHEMLGRLGIADTESDE
jgi:hypothetical protein